MNTKIATVTYLPLEVEKGTYASAGTFRLEMREAMKEFVAPLYFSKKYVDTEHVKNLGCLLFGQPNKWKGVISIKYDKPNPDNSIDIEIYIDLDRASYAYKKEPKELIDIIKEVLLVLLTKTNYVYNLIIDKNI